MAGFDDRLKNYASAGLRWGLCVEDHPDTQRTYYEGTGDTLGEPFVTRWPKTAFVVCQLLIPGHAEVHLGYKEIPTQVTRRNQDGSTRKEQWQNTYDNYAILQTQALGRALRSAGYPHSIPDLKLVMLWRRRNAEVDALAEALDAAAGDEDADDEEEAEGNGNAPPPRQVKVTPGYSGELVESRPADRSVDVMAPLLADDTMRSMWDQMTDLVQDELRAWVAASSRKVATTKAYMKFLLDREHAKMKQPETPNEAQPTDWVTKATEAVANGPAETPPAERDAEAEALLDGIAEMRDRLKALSVADSAAYAEAVSEMHHAKIEMSDRLTMEQLLIVDEIVERWSDTGNVAEPPDVQ